MSLIQILTKNGISEDTAKDFYKYYEALVEWNTRINLTAITDEDDVAVKHFLDSLNASRGFVKPGMSVIDVGTGAGFPGLAMLIARPDLDMTLMDSTKKRLMVIENILEHIGLKANVVHSRAEEGH